MSSTNYSKLRVLIVDDFNSFRLALSKMLSEFGFSHIDSAANGTEALNYCKKQSYDLVLCDYNLGVGKNGQQLLEELRQYKLIKQPDIFILLSAETSRNVVMSANDYEPDAYLTKPITNKMIEQRLGRLLNRRSELLEIFMLLEEGDAVKAIEPLKQKIASNSRYSMDCQKQLAELYIGLTEFKEAEKIYRSVLEMRPLNWAQVGLAQVRLCSGDATTAVKWLQQIIKANPSYMKAYDVLTQALAALKDHEGVQKNLQQAVKMSPLSLGRQGELAKTALDNGDALVAAKAYRKIIKHGDNSCHDTPETYANFGRSVVQCFDKDVEQAEHYSKELLPILDKMVEKFDLPKEDSLIVDLVKGQLVAIKGNKIEADQLIESLTQAIDENDLCDINIEIELVKTYMANHRLDDAYRLLDKMLSHYSDDQLALEKIDPLLSEPVSQNGKKLLAKVNKNGISAYQNGDFIKSIDCFSKAEKRFPRYVGVKLNLAQALIGKIKSEAREESDVSRCVAIFDVVKRYTKQDQSNYKRFLQLQEMLRIIAVSE